MTAAISKTWLKMAKSHYQQVSRSETEAAVQAAIKALETE